MVISNKNKIVFNCKQQSPVNNYFFYIVKEGYCFYTKSYIIHDFEDFYKATTGDHAFDSFKDYAQALHFGINQKEVYQEFKQSGFLEMHNPNSYHDFKIYKKGEFKNKREYLEAKRLQIFSSQDYIDFTQSDFENYNMFLMQKSMDF